jgi:hypothetical protein
VIGHAETVTEPLLLGAQVAQVVRILRRRQRDTIDDREAVPGEPGVLAGVVGDETEAARAHDREDLCSGAVVAAVHREALRGVRIDGVEALFLQRIGADLVSQADPPALVPAQVDDYTAAFRGDRFESPLQLGAAVTAQGAENVSGEALAVHSDQYATLGVARRGDVPQDEGEMLGSGDHGPERHGPEIPEDGRHGRGGDLLDEPFGGSTVTDQIRDGQDGETVLACELPQLPTAQHRAVLGDELTDQRDGRSAGERHQIDGRFGVSRTSQDTAFTRSQGEHMTGATEVRGPGSGVGERMERPGAISGRDPGSCVDVVDGDREGRLMRVGVVLDHLRQKEFVGP